MLNGMDMETNSHCYSSERLVFDHFDLLELLCVHNGREGQTRQVVMGVVFLPFNDQGANKMCSIEKSRINRPIGEHARTHTQRD
jgi:hypothetical protein